MTLLTIILLLVVVTRPETMEITPTNKFQCMCQIMLESKVQHLRPAQLLSAKQLSNYWLLKVGKMALLAIVVINMRVMLKKLEDR